MIESIKTKVWELLKEKQVSLVMLYDREGKILWHRGRKINGNTVQTGDGFSHSAIERTLKCEDTVRQDDVVITLSGTGLPQSARILYVKSLIIRPVPPRYFLYLDSGIKEYFSALDLEIFNVLGNLLGDVIQQIQSHQEDTGGISGTSSAIKEIRERVITYSLEEEPVLLLGETGVGKSHIARLIHRFSGRKGPFIIVNTPAIPENLFESEIFGHKKGAFTGASENKKGLVEEAQGGTIFFDEIAEVPATFQAKLLQFIESRCYRVLGDSKERQADVRILAATNRDLSQEVKAKRFRDDLYYRLNVLPIDIPPLRIRREDIIAILDENVNFLRGKVLDQEVRGILTAHDWPGNIRELIHVIKRIGIQVNQPVTPHEVRSLITTRNTFEIEPQVNSSLYDEEIAAGKSFWETLWKAFLDREISRKEIKCILERHFTMSHNSLKEMSQRLNIHEKDYPRFISALHKYQIHPGK